MDLNQIIAQTSAPHMTAVAVALDNLRDAVRASNAAGFSVILKGETENPGLHIALQAILDPTAAPQLEYRATVKESTAT